MAEYPAMPLYTDAYIADTVHLTAAQHGAYLLLLMMAWRLPDCALPDDDDTLARWARMGKRTWLANKSVIMGYWELGDDALYRQKRLTAQRKYVSDLRSRNSSAGTASALKRKETSQPALQPAGNKNPTPKPKPKYRDISNDISITPLPPFVPVDAWQSYLKHRGKGFTQNAQTMALRKLELWYHQGHNVGEILETSVINGWKGLFPPKPEWVQKNERTKNDKSKLRAETAGLLDEIRAGKYSQDAGDNH